MRTNYSWSKLSNSPNHIRSVMTIPLSPTSQLSRSQKQPASSHHLKPPKSRSDRREPQQKNHSHSACEMSCPISPVTCHGITHWWSYQIGLTKEINARTGMCRHIMIVAMGRGLGRQHQKTTAVRGQSNFGCQITCSWAWYVRCNYSYLAK